MNEDEIHNYYQKKAGAAEQLSEPFQQEIINEWLAHLGKHHDLKQWRCLDFGSGMGLNLVTLKKFVGQIVVADVNSTCLENSKKKCGDKIYLMFC